MKIVYEYSHLGGSEILQVRYPEIGQEINQVIARVSARRSKVLIEVQFGKYAFMFYDMAKFQYFFNENKADVGIEIVPCHDLHTQMSSDVSYGEQLVYDIERLKQYFPVVPVNVILIDVDD